MENTMMPKPPIHWVRLRQSRMSLGTDSTSAIMVEPVVVKPDMASKKASVKLGSVCPIRYGRQPNRDKVSHDTDTMNTPLWLVMRTPFALCEATNRIKLVSKVISAEKGML